MKMSDYPIWNNENEYKKYDIVQYIGALYAALKNVPVGVEINDTSKWLMIYKNGAYTNHERYQGLLIEKAGSGGGGTVTWEDIEDKPSNLVQDASYVHTDNNYTTTDKTKLEGLADIEQVGTGLDLTLGVLSVSGSGQSINWSDIENKPTDLVEDSNYVHTDNNFTNTDKTKLDALADIESIGSGLTLTNGELSATGGSASYTAGDGIDITNNVISADDTVARQTSITQLNAHVTSLYNTAEQLRTDISGVDSDLTQFKADYVVDMASKQTIHVINYRYGFLYSDLLEMLKSGGAIIEWENQTYFPVVGFEDKVENDERIINIFINNTADIAGVSLIWYTWTVTEADKETVEMTAESISHSVTAVGVPWVAAQLSYKQDTLISGQNIKTVNGNSLLGAGDVPISGGNSPYVSWEDASFGYAIPDGDSFNLDCDQNTDSKIDFKFRSSDHASEMKLYSVPTKMVTDNLQTQINNRVGTHFQIDVEKWCGTYTDETNTTYQVYSKIIYIPALPSAAGITTYPHGILGIKQILQAYGFTTDGFVLNAPRQNIADNISIYQVQKSSTGGVAIEVGKDRSNKAAYVCLIYAKNN